MSRPPRILSETGMYHIIFRGINRQNLFEESADFQKMLSIIKELKKEKYFKLYAYCFMTNHVHLFIEEKQKGDIKGIMHRLLTRYVVWYNFKYERSGSLVANRFKSEPIENDAYYLTLIRYIHQNPLKAKIIDKLEDYCYSSYIDYIEQNDEFVDIDFALSFFSDDIKIAVKSFEDFHLQFDDSDFELTESKKMTDEQLKRRLVKITNGLLPKEIAMLPRDERNNLISILRKKGFTIGQLERLTGISRGIITRAKEI